MDPSQLNCCCRIKVIDAKRNGADWVKKNKESGGCGRGGEKSCVYFGRPLFFFFSKPPTEDDGDGTDVSVDVE